MSDIQELKSVQRTFTSKIAGMRQLHYWERLSRLSLMSLHRRRERFIILHMWKILNRKTSNDLEVSFVSRPRLGNLAVVPPKSKTSSAANQTLFDSSFAVQGPILWNAMPHHLNTIQDLEQFKSKPTQFLLSIPDKPPIKLLGAGTLQTETLCIAGRTNVDLRRCGVVRESDGLVKSWRNST